MSLSAIVYYSTVITSRGVCRPYFHFRYYTIKLPLPLNNDK